MKKLTNWQIQIQNCVNGKLGCDIGGAKELGVMHFPTNWGAKEPQNLPNHRVAKIISNYISIVLAMDPRMDEYGRVSKSRPVAWAWFSPLLLLASF